MQRGQMTHNKTFLQKQKLEKLDESKNKTDVDPSGYRKPGD